MTEGSSHPDWWLWGGMAAAVIAAGATVYAFGPFALGAAPDEPAPMEPIAEDPASAASE